MDEEKKMGRAASEEWDRILESVQRSGVEYKYVIFYPDGARSFCTEKPSGEKLLAMNATCRKI
ncbi:MAG: hypothetical protein PHT44_03585 [Candidatus Portnoybacteria bacterium]|nr:hypothetical protein [Candidatus Portnoybacteria bacterium]